IVLCGAEVKSIREGNVNLTDSFVRIMGGQAFLKNAHISQYNKDALKSFEEKQDRKLLLNKSQITKLEKAVKERGLTIVATKVYLSSKGLVKVEIAVARGKHTYDKKETLKQRDIDRDTKKQLKKL
ncbi:MAG: SsrA-binding protein SmpB, partial [Firmicutes bacterium]|nr:SsrA-binding protein SmpB [Bacillota bacterium]